jgi:hypothetical protein
MVVTSYEEAKQGLKDGKFISGERQIGKTSALVDIVAELHNGRAIVVVPNDGHIRYFRTMFKQRHPRMYVPSVVSSRQEIRGYELPIYADLFNHFLPGDRDRLRPHLTAGILGA